MLTISIYYLVIFALHSTGHRVLIIGKTGKTRKTRKTDGKAAEGPASDDHGFRKTLADLPGVFRGSSGPSTRKTPLPAGRPSAFRWLAIGLPGLPRGSIRSAEVLRGLPLGGWGVFRWQTSEDLLYY